MKFRFKHWKSDKWVSTSSMKVLEKAISKLGQGGLEIIEVRKDCSHKDTFVDDGIRCCKLCGEQLEVTSYRD